MRRHHVLLLFLIFGLSCNLGRQERITKQKVESIAESRLIWLDSGNIQSKPAENVRFDFKAERVSSSKETIEINATIFNDNSNAIYFLSSTCEGEQYSLQYDNEIFILTPLLQCNVNFPKIIKVAPNEQHNFQAHFRFRRIETKIKLGFDFYSVNESFDLDKISLADIYQRSERTIIWANEKAIK